MRTRVKIIRDCQYPAGSIVTIKNNEAHQLVEDGYATRNFREYKNRMMSGNKKYRTKRKTKKR